MSEGATRYKLTLRYDGRDFHGWQRQIEPSGELRTVAGVVEATLERLLKQRITLVGASRTDAGVHAEGQVAHFDAVCPIPTQRLARVITEHLPPDVEAAEARPVDPAFHAIRDTEAKGYRYRIFTSRSRPLAERDHVWHCWRALEAEAMAAAAKRLEGTHDFAAFAAAGHGRRSTVRTIFRCAVETRPPERHVVVEGDGFLYGMVRIIAGTLVAVGEGGLSPEAVDRLLERGDRREAGRTLPASGLWLEWIRHAEPGQGIEKSPSCESSTSSPA